MDHTVFFNQTLTSLGYDLVPVYNCFDLGYDPVQGWPLKLPDVNFKHNTLLLLHFQDFVTPTARGCIELDRVEQKYGAHAKQVLVTFWSHGLDQVYQGPVNLIEFSSHNIQTIQGALATQHQWQQFFDQPRTQAWQCLNGRMCLHRRRVVDQLLKFDNGTLSYGNEIALPEWSYQTYRGTENHDNFVRLAPLYARSAVNIVTETQYDSRPGIITEKTLQAMIAQQVPVVIGHPGIVQDCQELGFDMFEDLVDCSYDLAPNDSRAELAITLNQDLILGRIDLAPYQARLAAQRDFVLHHYAQQCFDHFTAQARRLGAI